MSVLRVLEVTATLSFDNLAAIARVWKANPDRFWIAANQLAANFTPAAGAVVHANVNYKPSGH